MKLPLKTVREAIAYVPQDNFLFSDTIERNIAFAYEGIANHDDVVKVATLADLASNIEEFKEGYETMLGERGVTISGGQKQRTSIARALIKNASILILDDSVSAVDTKTEKIILDNLRANAEMAPNNNTITLLLSDSSMVSSSTHHTIITSTFSRT